MWVPGSCHLHLWEDWCGRCCSCLLFGRLVQAALTSFVCRVGGKPTWREGFCFGFLSTPNDKMMHVAAVIIGNVIQMGV